MPPWYPGDPTSQPRAAHRSFADRMSEPGRFTAILPQRELSVRRSAVTLSCRPLARRLCRRPLARSGSFRDARFLWRRSFRLSGVGVVANPRTIWTFRARSARCSGVLVFWCSVTGWGHVSGPFFSLAGYRISRTDNVEDASSAEIDSEWLRINCSMTAVAWLPQRSQMTLGGAP